MSDNSKVLGTFEHFENNKNWFNQGGFFPSFAIPDVLNNSECDFIENKIRSNFDELVKNAYDWDDRIPKESIMAEQYYWNWGNLPEVERLIEEKVFFHVPEKIPFSIGRCSLVDAYYAYGIHSDYLWGIDKNRKVPHRTILIPLVTADIQTVILNQYGPYLHFTEYKNDHGILPKEKQISDEDFNNYLSHCWPQEKEYISIRDILPYTKGAALSFDRQFFHSGSNFRAKGMSSKKFIVIWTYLD